MREAILLTLLCLLLAIGSLGVFVWAISNDEVRGLDGILLLMTSLLLAIIFLGVARSLLRSEPLRALFQPHVPETSDGGNETPPKSPPQS